jgi:ectoine hydroxylase-related dioxygenase (phytanoyl-CoA dioxygenase family)
MALKAVKITQGERPADDLAVTPTEIVALPKGAEFPKPVRDLAQAQADLAQWGYALVEGVLDLATVAAVRDQLYAEIAAEEAADPSAVVGAYTFRDDKVRTLRNLPGRHKLFRDLLEHPTPLALVDGLFGPQYLGESCIIHGASAIVQKGGAQAQGVHADQDYVRPYVDAPFQLRVMWILTDFTDEIGATRLVPGSHRWGHIPDKSGATRYETVAAEAPAGSILVWDGRTYHGAGANRTDRDRPVIVVGYGPPWLRPMTNFPLVVDPAAMRDASPTLRRLLGYTSMSIGFDSPWEAARPEVRDLVVPPAP